MVLVLSKNAYRLCAWNRRICSAFSLAGSVTEAVYGSNQLINWQVLPVILDFLGRRGGAVVDKARRVYFRDERQGILCTILVYCC
jgi:hypothetical protein